MKQFYGALILGIISLMLIQVVTNAQTKSTFEDLLTDPSTYWNGQSSSYGNFSSVIEDSIFQFINSFSRNDYGYVLFRHGYLH